MNDALLTADELAPMVARIIERMPDVCNPRDIPDDMGSTCLYTSSDGQSHCLVGQLAADNGWKVPGRSYREGAPSASRKYGWPINHGAEEYLRTLQLQADEGGLWGDINPYSKTFPVL